ncbi:MAG: SRPBCC family protein [Boseongicola sp.]|nr:SRPBCC family protein [Boseongicola sp.]
MKLASQRIVEAPIADVYAAVMDFQVFEEMLSARGAQIERRGPLLPPEPGAQWVARFKWHDRAYDVQAELVSVDPGSGYAIDSHGNGITCMAVVDLQQASVTETKLFISFDFGATSFSSKLLLQTLRLTGPSLNRRLDKRVETFAAKLARRA